MFGFQAFAFGQRGHHARAVCQCGTLVGKVDLHNQAVQGFVGATVFVQQHGGVFGGAFAFLVLRVLQQAGLQLRQMPLHIGAFNQGFGQFHVSSFCWWVGCLCVQAAFSLCKYPKAACTLRADVQSSGSRTGSP